jgi:hypothetical protein
VSLVADAGRMARARRLLIAFVVVVAGIVAGFALYVGFVQAGLLPNPFGPVVQGDLELARSGRPGLRVLFVGNSLTYYNDMPDMVSRLADGDPDAKPLFAVSFTRPGGMLKEAAYDGKLERLLGDSRWDFVVIQEQSTLASSSPSTVGSKSVPAAMRLHHLSGRAGARMIVYMTWPWRYEGDLADQLGVPAAPVGLAWAEARRRRPALNLLDDDGHHPNLAGSYLAACVFYELLTGRDPKKSTFTAGLAQDDARFLRALAAGDP